MTCNKSRSLFIYTFIAGISFTMGIVVNTLYRNKQMHELEQRALFANDINNAIETMNAIIDEYTEYDGAALIKTNTAPSHKL